MLCDRPQCVPAMAYRPTYGMTLLFALIAAAFVMDRHLVAAAEGDANLDGVWKLVRTTMGEMEWATFEIKHADGKPVIELINAPKMFGKAQIYMANSPDALTVLLALEQSDITFKGRLRPGGADDRIEGAMQFRTTGPVSTSGARLEKTKAMKVAAPREVPKKPGAGGNIAALLELRKATAEFLDDRYKSLELTTAAAAAAGVPIDAPTTARLWAVSRLADASRRAAKADAAVESELARLKALIAEENRPSTVPLGVEPVAGRPGVEGNQVILFELFTGAQCGPCVAADVAFDALSATYKPIDLITVQYHLHIPGPDPLTSPGSIARQAYYGVRSTPSTYFNGQPLARGGGSAADSRRKFNQYRFIIDEQLKAKKNATIELVARRTGDDVLITASASIASPGRTLPGNPRLRLALIEESVPYTGRNGLSSHHHVVRAMPGGAEGRAMAGGKIQIRETINLSNVRSAQETYLKDYPKSPEARGPFSGPLPPVELNKLSVVAFIQDDSDRMVLHAIIVPVN